MQNVKKCFGGGDSSISLSLGEDLVEMPRCAKRNCHCEAKSSNGIVKIFKYPLSQSHSIKRESVKLFSLPKRKISSLQGRESSRLNAVNYGYERGVDYALCRGVKRHKNTNHATECAMTDIENNLHKKQPNCLATSSPAASFETNHSQFTTHHSPKR